MKLKGQLQVTSWQEDEIRTLAGGGGKVTRAGIGYRMTGDIDGEAVDDVVMYYRADGTASVVGLWQVAGAISGRTGSVMFSASGEYDGTTALSRVRVVPSSGTGDFAALSGTGTTSATSEHAEYALDLEF